MPTGNVPALATTDGLAEALRVAVRIRREPQYVLARRHRIPACTLSQWTNGIRPVPLDDPRLRSLCMELGVSLEEPA